MTCQKYIEISWNITILSFCLLSRNGVMPNTCILSLPLSPPPSPNPKVHASVSIPATLHHAPLHCLASAPCSAGAGSIQEQKSQSQRPPDGWISVTFVWPNGSKWGMLECFMMLEFLYHLLIPVGLAMCLVESPIYPTLSWINEHPPNGKMSQHLKRILLTHCYNTIDCISAVKLSFSQNVYKLEPPLPHSNSLRGEYVHLKVKFFFLVSKSVTILIRTNSADLSCSYLM